ncbi:hypothetical protein KAH81_02925, partial [bacterium]|nr:hypothetical protein [bacterium]
VYTDIKIPEIAKVGEVLSFDPSNTIKVIRARNPYDPNVFGVVVLDSFGQKRIAIGGEVDVLIDKSLLFFEAGVWLVTSGSTGRAMPLEEGFPLKAVVIGITLESWSSDKNDSIYTVKTFLTPGERITPKKHLPSRDE